VTIKVTRKLRIAKSKSKPIEIGDRFGYLEVIDTADKKGSSRHLHYLCLCHRCGKTSIVPSYRLKSGATQSCGCTKIKHGHATFKGGTHEYGVWIEMRRRCNDPRHRGYERYGGRGIRVCDEWEKSFEAFFEEMGPCPPGYQIDRIDNSGNYEPGNCRWASLAENNANRRDNIHLEFNGETKIMAEWAREWGVKGTFIGKRIKKGCSMGEIYELAMELAGKRKKKR
jgi:hypothetical protein